MGLEKTVTKNRKIYGSYKVLSPDNILMFYCGEKKINWYLNRNLAEWVDSYTIRLNFEPKGYGNHNDDFGLTEMQNRCVNCGSKQHLTRHHVVPNCYRKHFPLSKKSHNFHDIVAMCPACHETYEGFALELKTKLAKKYDISLNGIRIFDHDLNKIQRKLHACELPNVPLKRKKQLIEEIKRFYGWQRLTSKRINWIKQQTPMDQVKTHGEVVVSKIKSIEKFVRMWRKHFIMNNRCEYLTENWSIDYEKKI